MKLPVIPLRNVVLFPKAVIPLFIGRETSMQAVEDSLKDTKKVFLVAQVDATIEEPTSKDIFQVGTIADILQLIKMSDGKTMKVITEGQERSTIHSIKMSPKGYMVAEVDKMTCSSFTDRQEENLILASFIKIFENYCQTTEKISDEVRASVSTMDDPVRTIDQLSGSMLLKLEDRQRLLEISDLQERIEFLMAKMQEEIDVSDIEKNIQLRVKEQMEQSQREYYLNEKMKAIQKELGEASGDGDYVEVLKKKVIDCGMPKETKEKTLQEVDKLSMMSPLSAEASVIRSYIDWMVGVPWKKRSRVHLDMESAQIILDEDHYGLVEVKDRILEYLAVQKRVKRLKGPVLCLVGPPGVGKTSLGESIARATNRKFIRMSLGGVRDESEIRGHRRTYIGSMPGKIIQKMARVGVRNPLFLLDEIDKMGMDYRGDPAAALLEVLDPEQNNAFSDHYLEVDYDLSEVMFVCTSNTLNIPEPLLDRMETIRIPGYTEEEKKYIAKEYLFPKQKINCGLRDKEIHIGDDIMLDIIRDYTRESGVRNLEREVAKLCRKVVKDLAVDNIKNIPVKINGALLEEYCGAPRFTSSKPTISNSVGQVNGLSWTQYGGELLTIEATLLYGKGSYIKTGSLGDVMQESMQAALSVVRSRIGSLGIPEDFNEKYDIHVHVPEGATPKDGPSAGIGICTAIVSVLTGIPVKSEIAMTGEITLRGEVLRVGGLKEKLLAAHRHNMKTVIIPEENQKDLMDVPDMIREDLDIRALRWIDDVLDIALEKSVRMPNLIGLSEQRSQKGPITLGFDKQASTH